MLLRNNNNFIKWHTVILTIFLVILFYHFISIQIRSFNPIEADLGEKIKAVRHATIKGHLVRNNPISTDLVHWQNALPKNSKSLIMWTGNSHLLGINEYVSGQQLSSVHLHKMINGEEWPGQFPVFGIAYPNLRFQEQFLISLYLCLDKTLPQHLVFVNGYRYADTRESSLREGLPDLLKNPKIVDWLHENEELLKRKYPLSYKRLQVELNNIAAEGKTVHKTKKSKFVELVGSYIPIYKHRREMRGVLFLSLYNLRNYIFRINSATVRPVLLGRYNEAMEFMELTAEVSKKNNVHLLMYNIPFRPSAANPYPEHDYHEYKKEMAEIANKYTPNVFFKNYEDTIPEDMWGYYDSKQPDFSHFKEEGHIYLAKKLKSDLFSLGLLR